MEIHNKRIIVTGAASGIGRAFLLEVLDYEPLAILAADRDESTLLQLLASLPVGSPRILPFVGDLSQKSTLDALFETAQREMQGVDIFVANAGFAYYESYPAQANWDHLQRIFELNVYAPLYTIQKMKELNPNKSHYTLITASAMAKTGIPGYAVYGATKAALDRFLDAYRYEDSGTPTVGLVYPIATRTAFFLHSISGSPSRVPVTPWPSQTPEQVAQAMLRSIRKNQRFIYPSLFFRLARLPQQLFEWLMLPYQWYYARQWRKWKNGQ
ncbi:SDR family oxidoreductase [Telluribacter sp. SYSU D00476]|uniref:SDR family NAD(P)-dependent oxidoreductase n=1 Tax=Telluribacter sp. SYSU D00476 TaxID=2811430 RepID=UPI001FF1A672|nr:SDR family NAD(P)-dependent oxidoreductase [Telluribacter sp. SYSU D00476]